MIDRGGDFVCVCLQWGLKFVRANSCVLKLLYLFGSTSQQLCGHCHIVFSVVSERGLNVSKISGCGMTKCFLSGLMLLVGLLWLV